MEESAKCAFCGEQANQRCTGCLTTFYCSKDHQKQHWKKHKHHCCAFKICQCGSLGRYLIATRDLKPGELILKEKPLLVAPGAFVEPICTGCYGSLKGKKELCDLCEWPLCSKACQNSPNHEPECLIMQQKANLKQFKSLCTSQHALILQIVAILKCVALKAKEPQKYEKLVNLQSHTQERKKNIRFQTEALMIKTIRSIFNLDAVIHVSDKELLEISGIFMVNSHEVPITALPIQAVYDSASMIEHSCINNASKHFDEDSNILIRAAIPIKKGERISINYSDPMWGTASRQSHLAETKFFQCSCDRCRDPLELNTHFSSVKCPNCPESDKGYLSPRTPMQSSGDWMCDQCRGREPSNYVNAVIKSIGEEIVQLERGSKEACLNFLEKHSQNLHSNHFFLMDVKLALSQMIGKCGNNDMKGEDVSEKELVTKQKLCMDLLEVVNVISPGISRLRGVVLYELQSALSSYARIKFSAGEISEQHMKNIMQEVKKYLNECIQIFSYEPACISEGQLAAIARLALVETESYLDSMEGKQS